MDADTDADSETGTPDPTDVPFTPVTIELASVVCDGSDVQLYLYTTGWTDGARVFTQETGTFGTQWADTHDLASYESDPGGTWDHLALRLHDGSTLADPETDWVRNESTAFTCEEQFGQGVLSFAFAAFDRTGSLADCLVYGNDAQGLLARSFDRVSDPDFETSGCRIGDGVGLN